MKKYIFIIFIVTLIFSCSKDKCWIMSDCLGNDIGSYCGTERQVQEECQTNSTPTCACSYRRD